MSSLNGSVNNMSNNYESPDETLTTHENNKDEYNSKDIDIGIFIPKDAVEVLNELKPGLIFETKLDTSKKIIACVKINDKTYSGTGKSETIAKQSAAEHALRDLLFDMIVSTMSNIDNDSQYNSNSWKLLGSLAMFKLIEEWLMYYMSDQSFKNIVEASAPNGNINNNYKTSTKSACNNNHTEMKNPYLLTTLEKKVVANNTNAIVLLNALMGSNLTFTDLCVNKNKPPFTFSLLVDDVEYVGEPAGNKRDAKQNVAKKVLIKKYGYEFSKD